MWSRDSAVWLIAFMLTILGYLSTKETDPRFWSYMDWINFLMFVLAWLSGKMANSPRPGENDGTNIKRGNMGAWLLPVLLVGSLATVTSCGGTFKPPVITPDDQAKVQELAVKALAGIEIAGVVMRDGRQLVSDLERAGTPGITREVRTAVNDAVIRANDDVIQPVITHIDQAVKKTGQLASIADVKGWAREGINAFLSVARVLEQQTDGRVTMVGKFIRSALEVLGGLVGIEVTR